MRKVCKRSLAWLLVLGMTLSCLPMSVLAAEVKPDEHVVELHNSETEVRVSDLRDWIKQFSGQDSWTYYYYVDDTYLEPTGLAEFQLNDGSHMYRVDEKKWSGFPPSETIITHASGTFTVNVYDNVTINTTQADGTSTSETVKLYHSGDRTITVMAPGENEKVTVTGGTYDPDTGLCTVSVGEDATVNVVYTKDTDNVFTVETDEHVTVSASGGVTAGTDGSFTVPAENSSVTFTASVSESNYDMDSLEVVVASGYTVATGTETDDDTYTATVTLNPDGGSFTIKAASRCTDNTVKLSVAAKDAFDNGVSKVIVEYGTESKEYKKGTFGLGDTRNDVITIPEGTGVTVSVVLDNGYILTNFAVNDFKPNEADSNTLTFTTGKGVEYVIDLSAGEKPPVEVEIDKYDVIGMRQGDETREAAVRTALAEAAFGQGTGIDGIYMTYHAGDIEITLLGKEYPIPVDLDITAQIPGTKAEWVDLIYSKIGSTFITEDLISTVLGDGWTDFMNQLHEFGAQDTELLSLVKDGNTVKVQANMVDNRLSTELDINESVTVPYGSYADADALLDMILEGKQGLTSNGTPVTGKTLKLSLGDEDLVMANVGTKTIQVIFDDEDLDYKGCKKDVTLTITKADVSVDVKSGYQAYTGSNTKEDFLTITPDLASGLTDDVAHVYYSMGLDVLDQQLVANVDLSKVYVADDPITQGLVDTAIKGAITVADPEGDGMALSDLVKFGTTLIEDLEKIGVDLNLPDLTNIMGTVQEALEKVSEYADIRVRLVYNNGDITPNNHGAYLLGAVTTDPNYKTAQDMGYLVISVDPVTVKFEGGTTFAYDGTAKTPVARAYDQNNTELTGTMQYRYVGLQSDGKVYNSNEAPSNTGVYTVFAMYLDDPAKPARIGFAVTEMVIQPANTAVVTVEDKIHTYDGNAVDLMSMITVEPSDAEVAYITAQVNINGDFSEDGWSTVGGKINIDFPDRVDQILAKLNMEDGIRLSDFKNAVEELQAALKKINIDSEVLDRVVTALEQYPDATLLTFDDFSAQNPSTIGVYLVSAVVFDPNYVPAADAGILVIQPNVETAKLYWNDVDENGIYTYEFLQARDMNATCTDSTLTSKIQYRFFGVNSDGKFVALTDKADLTNGGWTQIAYIPAGISADITLVTPIARAFVVVPNTADVDVTDVDVIYDGNPHAAVVTVDGQAVTEHLTVRYTGIMSDGQVYNSTAAPTQVGVYTVNAVYLVRDSKGEIEKFGADVGTVVIRLADSGFALTDTKVPYDGNGHFATVTNPQNMEYISMAVGVDGKTLFVNLPDELENIIPTGSVSLVELKDKFVELENKAENAHLAPELKEKLTATIAEINAILEKSPDVINVSTGNPVEVGTYQCFALAYSTTEKPIVAKAQLIIAPVYQITFNANGGSGSMEGATVEAGAYTLPACGFTAPTGKQFKGWATSADGTVISETTYNVTTDVTFYAIWEDVVRVENLAYVAASDYDSLIKNNPDQYAMLSTYPTAEALIKDYLIGVFGEKTNLKSDDLLVASLPISWQLKTGTQYSSLPEAENTFVWTVSQADFETLGWTNTNNIPLTGELTLKNLEGITITPADITIYTGGEGYTGIVDDMGHETTVANGMPEPGYYITLPDEFNNELGGNANAADLSTKLTLKYEDGTVMRTWTLELYGTKEHSTNVANEERTRYIYRINAGIDENGKEIPIRLKLTDPEDPSKEIISDQFNPSLTEQYEAYKMSVYSGGLKPQLIVAELKLPSGKVVTCGVNSDIGNLVVRGLTDEKTTTEILQDETSLSGNTISVVAPDTGLNFYVNGSNVELTDTTGVRLLVDDVLDDGVLAEYIQENMRNTIPAGNYTYDQQYMDLVDTKNGNAYLTLGDGQSLDVYWKVPSGMDSGKAFYVVHFDGLDRDYDNLSSELENNTPDMVPATLETINGTQYIKFEAESFSPFVLVYEQKAGTVDPSDPTYPGSEDDDYTLHYVTNGGKHLSAETKSSAWTKDYEDLPVPERDGYTFVGWYWDLRLTDPVRGDVKVDKTTVDLYAKWEEDGTWSGSGDVSDWLDTVHHKAFLSGYPDGTFGTDQNMTRAEVAQMFYSLLLDKDVKITKTFTDVPADAWYADAVNTLASLGMLGGYPDGTFQPDRTITRAEFAVVALAFTDGGSGASCSFTDVNRNDWFYQYAAQASEYGWIGGYPDGSFRPNNKITRAEVSVIVNNMLGRDADERFIDRNGDELVSFTDLTDGHWAYYAIMEATNTHTYTRDGSTEVWKAAT